jgi:hypothetical protein
MTILPNSLEARDVAYYFHPATNARRHEKIGPLALRGHDTNSPHQSIRLTKVQDQNRPQSRTNSV